MNPKTWIFLTPPDDVIFTYYADYKSSVYFHTLCVLCIIGMFEREEGDLSYFLLQTIRFPSSITPFIPFVSGSSKLKFIEEPSTINNSSFNIISCNLSWTSVIMPITGKYFTILCRYFLLFIIWCQREAFHYFLRNYNSFFNIIHLGNST